MPPSTAISNGGGNCTARPMLGPPSHQMSNPSPVSIADSLAASGVPIGSSALPGQVGFTHERVVPRLRRAVIDEDVHATVDCDLERRREVHGAPQARAALAPDEHPIAGLQRRQSCRIRRPDRQFGSVRVSRARASVNESWTVAVRALLKQSHTLQSGWTGHTPCLDPQSSRTPVLVRSPRTAR
jgi:hypothetical protein